MSDLANAEPRAARIQPSLSSEVIRPRRSVWRRLRSGREAIWGLGSAAFLILAVVVALGAPLLVGHDPMTGDVELRLLPPGTPDYWLGTDALGRDLLARLLYGTRISLAVGFFAVVGAGVVGIMVGLVTGYRGGWLDAVGCRLIDVQLSFPFLALALSIAVVLGAGLTGIIVTLIISTWVLYARLVRGETMTLKNVEFIEAARALGAPEWRILLRHVLPNVLGPAIALGSLEAGRLIVAEASLSFLGYGVQPPIPAWGNMLAEGKDYMSTAWWLTVLPGVAISLTCLASSLLGDWLTDVLDPQRGS